MDVPVAVLLGVGKLGRRFVSAEPSDLASREVQDEQFERSRRHARRILERVGDLTGLDVLELGCANGGMLAELDAQGARAVGIDTEPQKIARAQQRGLNAVHGDAEALPFPDNSFDLIVSVAVLEHIVHIDVALREAARVLRPGGRFYAEWGPAWLTYNGPHLIKCLGVPWVHLLFSDATIARALKRQRETGVFPASYLNRKIEDFTQMGRVTRRKLRAAAAAAGFRVVREESWSPRRVKGLVSQVPPLDEMLAGELRADFRLP